MSTRTSKILIRLRSARHLSSRPAHMHSNEHYRGPPNGLVQLKGIFCCSIFNGTGIPCEGIITDLLNSISLLSIYIIILCSFDPTFGAKCSLGELQYQRYMFINSYFLIF